jgi:RNA polymerase sigma-70 factor (ECF subfamily)
MSSSRDDTARRAVECWLRDHGDVLWAFCLGRCKSPQVAEDVVQETLLAALQGADRFAGAWSERTWLLSIASHKVADHFRRQDRDRPQRGAGPDEFDERGRWSPGPAAWDRDPRPDADALAALRECLDKLPAGLGHAVWLRDLLDVPTEEACKLLGVTPTNLWTRLHRARAGLRRCVEASLSPEESS